MEKAVDLLRQKGLAKAMKRAGREASDGLVHSYIHSGGKIGVLVEVNCETDFAAKSEDFGEFVRNVALQIAASNPLGINPEDIPQEIIERERAIFLAQAAESGKPQNMLEKMVDGKMRKFYEENVTDAAKISSSDPDKSIQDCLNELIAEGGRKNRGSPILQVSAWRVDPEGKSLSEGNGVNPDERRGKGPFTAEYFSS